MIAVESAAGEADEADEDRGGEAVAVEVAAAESAVTEPVALEAAAPAAPLEVDEKPAAASRSRRSRQRASPVAPASGEVEPATSDVWTDSQAAAPTPAAVDSALSERVETLEHGLRRVLAEVKTLRELLADPSADR